MTEEQWQPLVASALVRSLGLRAECLHFEVPTRDGSRADLVYAANGRLSVFELKMAEPGEVLAPMNARAVRQLRHYCRSSHRVWLVTLGVARGFAFTSDGRVRVEEPRERQLLPEGVGWIVYDRLGQDVTVLCPAQEQEPSPEDRIYLVDQVLARLSGAQRAALECRA